MRLNKRFKKAYWKAVSVGLVVGALAVTTIGTALARGGGGFD